MNLETRLRAGIAMSLLSLIILTFFFFQQQDELKKCNSELKFISGGDIQKAELLTKVDSLEQENLIKDLQLGSYEMMWDILEETNKPLADSINLQVE
jgi:hypothetical protein